MADLNRTTCSVCNAPISQTPGPGRPRLYCSGMCRGRRYLADLYHIDTVEVIERWGTVCYLCGDEVDPTAPFGPDMLNVDHIVPVSRGGASNIENLRIVHYVCNLRKGSHLPCPHCTENLPAVS